MKERISSGIIMLPLLLVVYFGGKILIAGCFLIGILGVHEFYSSFRKIRTKPSFTIALLSAFALYAIDLLAIRPDWYMAWFAFVVFISFLYLFQFEKRNLDDAMVTIIGIFYVIFFSYHVTLVDQINGYSILIWLIFLSAFGTDVMAYFTGLVLGRHKLCPKISPKKTIEGSIGGILGSVLLCGAFGMYFAEDLLIHCIIIGVLGGVVSQLGDLTASIFKRKIGIKDYGNLIPGHGGILDRFDSVLFTAPMTYYYIVLILVVSG